MLQYFTLLLLYYTVQLVIKIRDKSQTVYSGCMFMFNRRFLRRKRKRDQFQSKIECNVEFHHLKECSGEKN